ncbi:MAG TPA: DNA translocase FtsK 4TM domain-containing protein, partial [Candidatus Sulfotelmatobacter sp.]|nr:DNA translocase FtsK 4TM domain-containing protein [Candidatus Sulfotelmatobacter sp.]
MPPKKREGNGKKQQAPAAIPSKFKQDITGILLIAVALFILLSNLSSGTGLVGLYVIKKALRSVIGVGIYALPLFIAAYGAIMLVRHEVKELTVRLTGLLVMFLVMITVAQFIAPDHFAGQTRYQLLQGAGGALGFAGRISLEKTIGLAGAYIFLTALGFIAVLLIFNITVQSLIALLAGLFNFDRAVEPAQPAAKAKVLPLAQPVKEVIPAPPAPPDLKPIVEFPIGKFEPENEPAEKKEKSAVAA